MCTCQIPAIVTRNYPSHVRIQNHPISGLSNITIITFHKITRLLHVFRPHFLSQVMRHIKTSHTLHTITTVWCKKWILIWTPLYIDDLSCLEPPSGNSRHCPSRIQIRANPPFSLPQNPRRSLRTMSVALRARCLFCDRPCQCQTL